MLKCKKMFFFYAVVKNIKLYYALLENKKTNFNYDMLHLQFSRYLTIIKISTFKRSEIFHQNKLLVCVRGNNMQDECQACSQNKWDAQNGQ